jgi:hypothetical protein
MVVQEDGMKDQIAAVEIYRQQYAHFGRLNDLLYKLPPMYSALVGALWYFGYVSKSTEPAIAGAVFVFAAVVCLYSIHVTKRFRAAFNLYINRINKFDREYAVTLHPAERQQAGLSTVGAVIRTLWVAFAISTAGAMYVLIPVLVRGAAVRSVASS